TLKGGTRIGERCRIGPHATISDSDLGDGVTALHAVLVDCRVADSVTIGPFAYLRPEADIHDGAKVGTFVEVKKSVVGSGAKIADKLGVGLIDAGLKTFTDGEVYCRYAESIRGADMFLVQSIVGNEDEGLTVNDALMELLVMIDAAVGASAHRVIAVAPWYGYSRQDKKSAPREPITARVVASCLETVGIDRLVTMDLHAGQLQGFFSRTVDHMTAMPILTQYVQDHFGNDRADLVIVAPDAGRVKLTRKFAQKVGVDYALL